MKIGILGSGSIGGTLAKRFSAKGHDVKVANSRGPETIDAEVLSTGAQPVMTEQAVTDVNVVILSIPFHRIPNLKPLLARLPAETVVIDTSNYIPMRDHKIEAIENGMPDSVWVAEQLGRPIAKAWNSIYSMTLKELDRPAGHRERVAAPVAADRKKDSEVAMALVEDSGLDAYDAGPIVDSWRQQPGSPCYCTEVQLAGLPDALGSADLETSRRRRDLAFAVYEERYGNRNINPGRDFIVRLSQLLNAV